MCDTHVRGRSVWRGGAIDSSSRVVCRWCDTIPVKDCLLNTVSSFNCECDTPMEFMAGGNS